MTAIHATATWSATDTGPENGSTCTIELKNIEWFGGYSAYVPASCPDGFFSANRWVLSATSCC